MKMKLTKNFLLKEEIAEQNAIFSAIENENEGEVKNLLDSGTDPNTRNELNQTPLHFAYILNADLIQTLITKGADVNAVDDSKKTPLHMASFFRDFDAMKLLLTNGAKANAQDMSANTPLINFCERSNKNRYPDEGVPVENKKKCFDLLVEAKADMNLKNKRGLSPLYIAYYYEDAELVNWLIGAGADVEKEGTEIRDGIKRFIAKNKTVTESKKQIKEANEAGSNGMGQVNNNSTQTHTQKVENNNIQPVKNETKEKFNKINQDELRKLLTDFFKKLPSEITSKERFVSWGWDKNNYNLYVKYNDPNTNKEITAYYGGDDIAKEVNLNYYMNK